MANTIWYGFATLHLNYDRWTRDIYIEEMEVVFSTLQGHTKDGISFSEKSLTDKQAAAIITLFSQYFDHDDVRLTLPNNYDWLVTSDEYHWCPSHGAWRWTDVEEENYNFDTDEWPENLICPEKDCEEVID